MWISEEKKWMEEPELTAYIKELKSQMPPEGRWIDMDEDDPSLITLKCSVCQKEIHCVSPSRACDIDFVPSDFKFCPNCGARMEDVRINKV